MKYVKLKKKISVTGVDRGRENDLRDEVRDGKELTEHCRPWG